MSRLLVSALCLVMLAACGAPAQPSAADLQATVQAQVQATLTAQQAQAPTPLPSPGAPTPTTQIGFTPSPEGSPMDMGAPALDAGTPQPTETPIPADPLTVEGTPVVLSSTYSTGELVYEAVVAFKVKNPNTDAAARAVPLRVTVKAGEQTLATSDPREVDVPAATTRLVTVPIQVRGTAPDTADVSLYSDPSLFVPAAEVPDQGKWTVENVSYECPENQVECEVNGDLTWTGDDPVQLGNIHVLAHQGDTPVAAGNGSADTFNIAPGQTIPFQFIVFGFPQAQPGGVSTLPEGELTSEVAIDAVLKTTP